MLADAKITISLPTYPLHETRTLMWSALTESCEPIKEMWENLYETKISDAYTLKESSNRKKPSFAYCSLSWLTAIGFQVQSAIDAIIPDTASNFR